MPTNSSLISIVRFDQSVTHPEVTACRSWGSSKRAAPAVVVEVGAAVDGGGRVVAIVVTVPVMAVDVGEVDAAVVDVGSPPSPLEPPPHATAVKPATTANAPSPKRYLMGPSPRSIGGSTTRTVDQPTNDRTPDSLPESSLPTPG